MYGNGYWSTGIRIGAHERADGRLSWSASLVFDDDGFIDTENPDNGEISTHGGLSTRYHVDSTDTADGLTVAIDTILRDAERLGIAMRYPTGPPLLYVRGDGEYSDEWLPAGWRERLVEQAKRIGWQTYDHRPGTGGSR